MKRLVIRIILLITIPFIIIMSLFVFISISSSTETLNSSIEDMLVTSTDSWAREFEGFFKEQLAIVTSYKAIIEDKLSIETIGDDEQFFEFSEKMKTVGTPILTGNDLTTLYTWFSPEYTGDVQILSIRDLEQNGNVTYNSETTYTRKDITDGDWKWFYLTEEYGTYITDPYYWEDFDADIVSICKAIKVKNQTVGIVGTDSFISDLKGRLLSQPFQNDGYYALLNVDLKFLGHPEFEGELFSDIYSKNKESNIAILSDESIDHGIIKSGNQLLGFSRLSTGWILLAVPSMDELNAGIRALVTLLLIIFAAALLIFIVISIILGRNISKPITEIAYNIGQVSNGYLDLAIDNKLKNRKDEIGSLVFSLQEMTENLRKTVIDIKTAATEVTNGSQQINSTAQELSTGSSEQASSTEEISASMEQLVSNIEQNTDNAQHSNTIASQAATDAEEGGAAVNDTVEAMKVITEKINIIDEIARNTNLLALNAAIEAARAGEAGKGFAVVADEVRKLAGRSQEASTEITEISHSSVKRAQTAGELINSLIPNIGKTSELVQEISSAGAEQNTGAEQVNNGILQLNEVIQKNAAISEELASMAEELSSQADSMKTVISFFKIEE